MRRTKRIKIRSLVACALLLGVVGTVATAQQRGDTTTVDQNLLLQIIENGLQLDPSPAIGAANRLEFTHTLSNGNIQQPSSNAIATSFIVAMLGQAGINVPSEVIDFANGAGDFSNVDVSPTLTVGIEGDVGGYYEVNSVENADVSINAPTSVPVVIPAANSFACGDQIDISTSVAFTNPTMSVTPPFYNMALGVIVRDFDLVARVGLEVDFCVGLQIPSVGCAGYNFSWNSGVQGVSLSTGIPALEPALVHFCEAAFAPGANEADLLACSTGSSPLLNIAQGLIDAFNAQNGTSYTVASFQPGQVDIFAPDLPPNGPTIPEFNGAFQEITSADVSFTNINQGETLRVSGTHSDVANMEIDLVSFLDYAGYTTSLSLGGGLGSIDAGDIAPTLQVDQEMTFDFQPRVPTTMQLAQAMPWQVLQGATVVASGNGSSVPFEAGQTVRLSYPQTSDDPTAASNVYGLDGPLSANTQHRYYQSFTIRALQLDIPGLTNFTALTTNIGKEELGGSPHVLENHTQTLASSPISLPGFSMDPEKPVLDISELTVRGVENLGGGERAVVYRLGLANSGDVTLNQLQAERNFAETFASAASYGALCTASSELGSNPNFDGGQNRTLLTAGNSLAIGQQATIDMLVTVQPEISQVLPDGCFSTVSYSASSTSSAVSPIGTAISDRYDQCRDLYRGAQVTAAVDLGAAAIDELQDFTIYGWKKVDLARAMALSKGHVGSARSLRTIRNRDAEDLHPRIVGDLHIADDLRMSTESLEVDYVQLGGRALYRRGNSSNLRVNGAISPQSACVTMPERPVLTEPNTAGGEVVLVAENEVRAIAPGTYKEIRIREGADVTFSAGTYDIGKLIQRDDNVTIRLDVADGPVIVNVPKFSLHRKRNLQMLVENGSTRDAQINYSGKRKLLFKSSVVQGTILAPEASVEVMEGSSLEGACYASRVKIGPQARFLSHDSLTPVDLHADCLDELEANRPVDPTP